MIRTTDSSVTVRCDAARCAEEFTQTYTAASPPIPGSLPPQEAWFAAYDQGWRNRSLADGYGVHRAIDVCPYHAARPNYL